MNGKGCRAICRGREGYIGYIGIYRGVKVLADKMEDDMENWAYAYV